MCRSHFCLSTKLLQAIFDFNLRWCPDHDNTMRIQKALQVYTRKLYNFMNY